MRLKQTAIIIIALLFSHTIVQSQSTTTAERVKEIEAKVIPHLKILLKDNYDGRASFNENVFKIPMLFNGQAADSVVDEILSQVPSDTGWISIVKQSFIYNNQMLVRHLIVSVYIGDVWVDFIRSSFKYNATEDITEVLLEVLEDGSWLNLSILRVTYNDSGDEIEGLNQDWDGVGWVNISRNSITYTANNLVDVVVSQDWLPLGWENTSQLLYAYIGVGDTLQQIIRQLWDGSVWTNDVLNNYTFDQAGNVIEIEYFVNDPSGDEGSSSPPTGSNSGLTKATHAFFKVERDVWIYGDPDFVQEFRTDKWIAPETAPGFWEDNLRTIYDMNSIGTFLYGTSQFSVDNVWINDVLTTERTTPQRGNLHEVLVEIWDTDIWLNFIRVLYSYKLFVSVVDDAFTPDEFQLSQNYPNPFNPETTIKFNLQRSGHTLLIIYNLKGEEVARLADHRMIAGSHSISWDAARFSSGVYFYQLKQNGIASTKKMLLLK